MLFCSVFYMAVSARAQDFSVTAENILTLARSVIAQANGNYALPTAYGIGVDGKHYIITLPMVAETFARTVDALNPNSPFQPGTGPFPKRLDKLAWDWLGPDPTTEEPAKKRTMIPIMATDTAKAAYALVQSFNGKQQPKIHARWKTRNQEFGINAAQLVLAMAVYIDKRFTSGALPEDYSYAIPDIPSPKNWANLQSFLQLDTDLLQAADPVLLQLTINGQLIASSAKFEAPLACCGPISVRINAEGPVREITVKLGTRLLQRYQGNGNFSFAFDSLTIPDGEYPLLVSVTRLMGDEEVTAIRSLKIINGATGFFDPMR